MNLLVVVGARPNFVKVAPLVAEFKKKGISYDLVHTGQHYDNSLSKIFFDQLEIPTPDLYLGVGSGTHGVQTGKAMMKIEELLIKNNYDLVCVVGDVNSTLAAALAAVKLHIPVAHIESGYRSFDMGMPEEINRVIVDRISQLLFAPTETAVLNLINEGISQERIFFVGNIMAETLLKNLHKIKKPKSIDAKEKEYVLLTVHRAENTDNKKKILSIFNGIDKCPYNVIFPAHPRTIEKLKKYGLMDKIQKKENIKMVSPFSYLEFHYMLSNSRAVLTDSGGVQEEALLHKVPCLTLRKNTERMITLQYGANTLVGIDTKSIAVNLQKVLQDKDASWPVPPLWDSNVSKRIVDVIQTHPELLIMPSNDFIK